MKVAIYSPCTFSVTGYRYSDLRVAEFLIDFCINYRNFNSFRTDACFKASDQSTIVTASDQLLFLVSP